MAEFLASFEDDESPSDWLALFQHWWDRNPAASKVPHGWVLEADGRIVGFLGLIPVRFQLQGESTVAFSGTTWRVCEEHRAHSLRLMYAAIQGTEDHVLFNSTPIPQVRPILQRLGFSLIPRDLSSAEHMPAGLLLANPSSAIARRLGGSVPARALSTVAGPWVGWYQGAKLRFSGRDRFEVERIDSVGDEFDRLWERDRARWPTTMDRSRASLDWYCNAPGGDKVLVAVRRDGELVGSVIYWLRGEDRRLFECVDMWVGDSDPAAVCAAAAGGLGIARSLGAEVVLFPCFSDSLGKPLSRACLTTIELNERCDFYRWGSADRTMHTLSADETFLTDTVGDNTFF
ncbi:MAG: hypothetical protein AAF389_18895 [Gemmatimonadota bacterium]